MATTEETLTLARQHHQRGEYPQAEQLYRRVLQAEPRQADALHMLGVLAFQNGNHEAAIACIGQALAVEPDRWLYHFTLGWPYHALGRRDEAASCYRRALALKPNHSEAHNNLGALLMEQGKVHEAAVHFQQAVSLNPQSEQARNNLGNALREQGKLEEAVACYQHALRLKPDYAEAYNNLGIAFMELGKLEEAAGCYQQALRLRSGYPDAYNNLGIALQKQGKLHVAVASYRQALALQPDYPQAHNNLGFALQEQGRLDEALASYREALRLRPDYAEAQNNLGHALYEQEQVEEAIVCFQRALSLRPTYAEAHNNLGNSLRWLGRLREAVASYEKALELKPDYAEAHSNMGNVLCEQNHVEAALTSYWRAVGLQPGWAGGHLNLSFGLLCKGELEEGWTEYEWRWRTKEFTPRGFHQPLWDGSDPAHKTVLLHAEQGFGDTIQFIRYAPLVKQRSGRVIVECPAQLMPILNTCPGIDEVVACGATLPEFDAHLPLMSLPRVFRTCLTNIPAPVPYLFASPPLVEHWRQKLNRTKAFRIGIAWHANPFFRRANRQRCIPLSAFAALARLEGVILVSLQKGSATEQVRALADQVPVTDLGSDFDERSGAFMDTAAVMKNLDLVVSADTSIVHLAGALAVPTWVALPFASDWRWFRGRDDTPWYPTLRLFRQREAGNWADVFERMAAELAITLTPAETKGIAPASAPATSRA